METLHGSGPGQVVTTSFYTPSFFIPKHAVKFCQKLQSGLGYIAGDAGSAPPVLQKELQRGEQYTSSLRPGCW